MMKAWAAALLMLVGSTIAFLQYGIPWLVYGALYYSILAIPILLFDGAKSGKASAAGMQAVSAANILPSGSKRQTRTPSKFRTSAYDAPKAVAKEESYVPEAVRKKDTMHGLTVYEIKWKGLSESQNTWASLDHFDQAPLAQYKQLLLDFEKVAPGSSSSPPRKSLGKDAKALWPPDEDADKAPVRASSRQSKSTASKTKVADNKENAAPSKPAPTAPSPKKTRSRSSSVARKTADKTIKNADKTSKPADKTTPASIAKPADDLSPRRTRRSVAQKI